MESDVRTLLVEANSRTEECGDEKKD